MGEGIRVMEVVQEPLGRGDGAVARRGRGGVSSFRISLGDFVLQAK